MRVVAFVNNRLGAEALRFLVERGDEVAALVIHPEARRRFGDEILEAAGLPGERVFTGDTLREPATLERLAALEPEAGVSVFFGYILRPELLALFPRGVVNLHPAYLPYNRGGYPNVWSIVEGTPAGATLHYIDPGIDTGDVIARVEVPVEPVDTGGTLYAKLEEASLALFREWWPRVAGGTAPRAPQEEGGSSHRTRDVERIDRIDLDRTYTGRELLDILRARTFPPHRGAWFEAADGRRVYVRVALEYGPPEGA